MLIIFWGSLAMLLYTIIVYPGIMVVLGRFWPRTLKRGENLPTISIIVAACNEERHIGEMIRQLEQLNYPEQLVERIVATDEGSADRTHEMLEEAEGRGVLRVIRPEPGLVGKNVSLDAAMAATTGEIVIFCDASARWRDDGIRKLAQGFIDPRIGCLSAHKAYWLEDGFGASSYRAYWGLEGKLDRGSSVLGYVPNASGGLHAVRRSLYRSVPNHMIRDLVDPAQCVEHGMLAVLDPEVPYLDAPWIGVDEVYRSRVRITQRALASTPYILGCLLRSGRPWTVWQYVSHKVLRWFLYLPFCGLIATSIALSANGYVPAMVALGVCFAAAMLAGVGVVRAPGGTNRRAHTHIGFFVLSILAMLEGCMLIASGRKRSVWR